MNLIEAHWFKKKSAEIEFLLKKKDRTIYASLSFEPTRQALTNLYFVFWGVCNLLWGCFDEKTSTLA